MTTGTTPLPWQQTWQDALYGPRGFYRRPEGPAAHFVTSVHGIPHARTVLTSAVLEVVRRHGLRQVVDLGAGRGALARELTVRAPHLAVWAVDVVDRPVDLPAPVRWSVSPGGSDLPVELAGLSDTLLLAHEWLDVVPCPVVRRHQERWSLVTVDPATGREQQGAEPPPADRDWLRRWVGGPVRRTEVGRPRDLAYADLVSRVRSGVVLAIDYGQTSAHRSPDGTLTGHLRGAQVRPVPDGSCDLTAHVAIDSLVEANPAARACRQHEALRDLLGPVRPVSHRLARTDPPAYLRLLGEQAAHRTLISSGGPGDFWWVSTTVGGPGERAGG